MARSSASILSNPHGGVSRTVRDGTTPRDRNFYGPVERPVMIGGTVYPPIMGSQEIVNPHGSTGSVKFEDTQILNTSIDKNLCNNGDFTPIFGKVIGRELSHNSSANI